VDDLRRCTQVDSHIKIKNVESFVVNWTITTYDTVLEFFQMSLKDS
jgi:hypothetical protein